VESWEGARSRRQTRLIRRRKVNRYGPPLTINYGEGKAFGQHTVKPLRENDLKGNKAFPRSTVLKPQATS
jgi:hypothetical protein